MDPGWDLNQLSPLVGLWVLAQVPDGTGVVLSEEDELGLHQFAPGIVKLPDDAGGYASDDFGQIGGGEEDAMGNLLAALIGDPPKHQLLPRLQGEPRVVDGGRTGER